METELVGGDEAPVTRSSGSERLAVSRGCSGRDVRAWGCGSDGDRPRGGERRRVEDRRRVAATVGRPNELSRLDHARGCGGAVGGRNWRETPAIALRMRAARENGGGAPETAIERSRPSAD